MKLNLPKKLWIGPYEYALKTVARSDPKLLGDNGVTYLDDEDRCILIAKNLRQRHRLNVVIHEIIHALNDVMEMDDPLPGEEEMTTKQGIAWTQFFLDNPLFEIWLGWTLAEVRRESQKESK